MDAIKKFKTDHLRNDPAHCLAPGLFCSLKRGERKKLKLDITYQYGDESIRFWGPEPLGIDDMRLLQGIIALSGLSTLILKPEPKTSIGQQLRLFMDPQWEALEADTKVIKTSIRALLRECGYSGDSGHKWKQAIQSLERMIAVTIIVVIGTRREGYHLISRLAINEESGGFAIAVNPRIARAIFGGRGTHIAYISMVEVRELVGNDPAALLHNRLSAWIGPGDRQIISIDRLIDAVWPGECSPAWAYNRKSEMRKKILPAIAALLAWTIREIRKDMYEISRDLIMPRCDLVGEAEHDRL